MASSSAATAAAPASPNLSKGAEGEKVGQIRKRVQDLSWKQRKEGDRDGREEDEVDEEEGDEEAKDVSDSKDAEEEETKPAPEPAPAPVQEEAKAKRTQPSFSSFSSKSSGFAAASAAKDKGDFLSSPPAASDAEKTGNASPSSASRTQPTFSSFSKSSSPFSSASNVAGPSWLAGKSGSTVTSTGPPGASGGIKPSTLGSVGNASDKGTPPAVASAASSSNEAAAKVQSTSGANSAVKNNLGFGAFASSKTFSSKGSSPASTSDKTKDGAEDAEEKTTQGKTFDEVLQQSEDRNGEAAEKPNSKVGSQFDAGHVDLRTGEEDEKTLTSARAKLYTMSEDKNWKERGTGTVRCNVGKEGGGGGRLGESELR